MEHKKVKFSRVAGPTIFLSLRYYRSKFSLLMNQERFLRKKNSRKVATPKWTSLEILYPKRKWFSHTWQCISKSIEFPLSESLHLLKAYEIIFKSFLIRVIFFHRNILQILLRFDSKFQVLVCPVSRNGLQSK